jgi:hypothetical protein
MSYATLARRYWETYLPQQTATLADPDSFFLNLEQQVKDRIQGEVDDAEPTLPTSDDPLVKAGARRAAIRAAEADALNDLVYLPPEPGTEHLELQLTPPSEAETPTA